MITAEISIEDELIILNSDSPSERYAIKAFIEKHRKKNLEEKVTLHIPEPEENEG